MAGARELADWFADLWTDKHSRPITGDLLELLDESWVRAQLRAPYEVCRNGHHI